MWGIIVWVILPCMCISFLWCSSSSSILTGFLFITGIILCIRWLNSNVAELGDLAPVVWFWFVVMPYVHHHWSLSIFIVCLMNIMQASTCLVLWWWYNDDTAWSMLSLQQKLQNFSETKLLPASDINLHDIP